MGGMSEINGSQFAAAVARAADGEGRVDPNAFRAEALIEGNRQLGAVHAQGLVDDLVKLQLGQSDLEAVIQELDQRLEPADASRVTEALDAANVNEGWLERAGESVAGAAVAVGRGARDGVSWVDRQVSDGMATANRYLDGVMADPDSGVVAQGLASAGKDVVEDAQALYGFSKGVVGQTLSTLGDAVDLGQMAWRMSTDANYRDVVMGMARSYAAEVAADPGKPIDDLTAAGQKALADWETGLAQARAEGREAEYLGQSGGAVALEVAATLIPVSKAAKLGKVAQLLDKITPDGLAQLGRELGDLSRHALSATGDAAAGAMQALKGVAGLAREKGQLGALVTALRASGNMDGMLKAGALTPRELTQLQRASPEVFSGKVAFNDALAASTRGVDVTKLTSREVGAIGEALVVRDLVAEGYTDIVSIQNASNHGIDIVARNKGGDLEFFEVKASAVGAAKPPVAGAQNFVQDRLLKAIGEKGHWKPENTPPGLKELAKDLHDEITSGAPTTAKWVQVNLQSANGLLDLNATTPVVSPWPK